MKPPSTAERVTEKRSCRLLRAKSSVMSVPSPSGVPPMLSIQTRRFHVRSAEASPTSASTPRQRTSVAGSTPAVLKFQLLHPVLTHMRPMTETVQSGGGVSPWAHAPGEIASTRNATRAPIRVRTSAHLDGRQHPAVLVAENVAVEHIGPGEV